MRERKAQSSVEYLGTYAWAFLGLIITVGALNYFGVLNPSSYTPERCESGSQITCTDTYIGVDPANNHDILLMFTNNYPREIELQNVTINNLETPLTTDYNDGIRVSPGRTYTASFSTSAIEFIEGQKEHLTFTITYRRYVNTGNSVSHNISGSAVVSVQAFEAASPQGYCGDGNQDGTLGEACDSPLLVARNPSQNIDCNAGSGYCRSDCTCVATT